MRLGHELVDVVVVAVVYAVDVAQPTVPACPLWITHPPLREADHPGTIGINTVVEVEVLYLDLLHTGCYTAATMSSCSLTGVRDESSSILHSTYATLVVSSATRGRMREVVLNGPGIVFDPVAIRRVQRSANDLCEAAGEVQEEPEPGEQIGSGEGRTGERNR